MRLLSLLLCLSFGAIAQEEDAARRPGSEDPMNSATFSGLRLRAIGPAFTSGRVVGFAVDPDNSERYFVAAA